MKLLGQQLHNPLLTLIFNLNNLMQIWCHSAVWGVKIIFLLQCESIKLYCVKPFLNAMNRFKNQLKIIFKLWLFSHHLKKKFNVSDIFFERKCTNTCLSSYSDQIFSFKFCWESIDYLLRLMIVWHPLRIEIAMVVMVCKILFSFILQMDSQKEMNLFILKFIIY